MYYKDAEKALNHILRSAVKSYNADVNPCRNCQYYIPYIVDKRHLIGLSKCTKYMHSINTRLNQPTITSPVFANIMRSNDMFCGPKGRFFNPIKDL
jgi:hypothetical protein